MGYVNYKGPDLDRYIIGRERQWVTYKEGAELYNMPFWTFVHLAKEAKATMPLRKTAMVDIGMFDAYLESVAKREDKISRLKSLTKKDAEVDESIEDTLKDIIGYTLLMINFKRNEGK